MSNPIDLKALQASGANLGKGEPIVRPVRGLFARVFNLGLGYTSFLFAVLRNIAPILVVKNNAVVTRYDDVKEALLADDALGVTYNEKLDLILGGVPFFLGMNDKETHNRDKAALTRAVPPEDVAARLVPAAEAAAEHALVRANGKIEVVDQLFRKVTFEVLFDYLGTPKPPDGDVGVWVMRMFEFLFADARNDPGLRKEVELYAPVFRNYIQELIDARRKSGEKRNDVLGNCLDKQSQQEDGFSDEKIRAGLISCIVGGLPQLPMVGPNALEQLLRRPSMLAEAQLAARNDCNSKLAGYVMEAIRFDPLGPGLSRTLMRDYTLAAGTSRAKDLPKGMSVFVSFASAMRDGRRIRDPDTFIPDRPACNYIHFGHGLHECFGTHINRGLLPAILKPLLKRSNVTRAPGAEGQLRKQGVFADRLVVCYGPS
jgi:cytochrome P450